MNRNNLYLDTQYKQLDILRAICAFFVFNCHFFAMFPQKYSLFDYFYILINAKAAVIYFFILSGAVITYSTYKKEKDQSTSFKKQTIYFFKRYLRLLPVIFFSIIITWCICRLGLLTIQPFIKDSIWLKHFYFANFPKDSFLIALKDCFFNAYFAKSLFNGNLWTIPYELIVACIIYFLTNKINTKKHFIILLILVSLVTFTLINTRALFVMSFFWGMIITKIILSNKIKINPSYRYILLAIPILLLNIPSNNTTILNLITLISVCIIIFTIGNFTFHKITNIYNYKFIKNFSEISYEFYGFHLLIFISLTCQLQQSLMQYYNFYTCLIINYIITFIATYFISLLFHKYFVKKIWNKTIKILFDKYDKDC